MKSSVASRHEVPTCTWHENKQVIDLGTLSRKECFIMGYLCGSHTIGRGEIQNLCWPFCLVVCLSTILFLSWFLSLNSWSVFVCCVCFFVVFLGRGCNREFQYVKPHFRKLILRRYKQTDKICFYLIIVKHWLTHIGFTTYVINWISHEIIKKGIFTAVSCVAVL